MATVRPAKRDIEEVVVSAETSSAEVDEPPRCASCGRVVAGRYCAYCGQREFAGPHTIRGLILPSLQRVLGLEGGLLHTIVHLTIAPGRVVREYLSGRMTPYTHPAAYLLISFAAFALLSNTLELVEPAMDADPTWAVPILFVAGLSRLFFWRARFNYAEHLILVIYIVAQILLFLGLAIGGLFLTVGTKISVPILLAPLGLAIGYFAWGYSRFFDRCPARAAGGGLAALFGGVGLFLVVIIAILNALRAAGWI